jgi:maleylacetate reductase
MRAFVYSSQPSRVVFRAGALDDLAAEIERLGAHRALVLSTPEQRASAEDVARRLGARSAGVYAKAVMHVPIETAEAAREAAKSLNADCCVAIGGGSTIGLGKAIALTSDLPILAIPTTFAGSEMTPIYGITADGQKKTGRDPRVLPKTVIYDPLLTMTLPANIAGPSGMNAIAHCVEALYAQDANPITSMMAEEGIRALASSLPLVVSKPDNLDARAEALYGAWLAGACLGNVGMAIHHKLCHTLGGSFNLPHAQTHTIILPHAVRYNRDAAPAAMARIGRALARADLPGTSPASGLYDLARKIGAPLALRDIGMKAESLDEAARLATQNPYYNPRPIEYAAIRQLLQNAWEGVRPG